ncbi:MAG: toll/interleukin-1 receptor domain-containing protein, partial [Pseudolabrys sp.]
MADVVHDASRPALPQQASGPDPPERGKLRVFISYSRDDLKFADQLDAALGTYGFECLIDRHGISGGEDWKRRLGKLISEADTVVFVLSPTSARSEICAWEVKEATRLGKRILPVNCQP